MHEILQVDNMIRVEPGSEYDESGTWPNGKMLGKGVLHESQALTLERRAVAELSPSFVCDDDGDDDHHGGGDDDVDDDVWTDHVEKGQK